MDSSEVSLLLALESRSHSPSHLSASTSCRWLEGEAAGCELMAKVLVIVLSVLDILGILDFILIDNFEVTIFLIDWDRGLRGALSFSRLLNRVIGEHINVCCGVTAVFEELVSFLKSLVLILLASVHDAHDADSSDCDTDNHGYSHDSDEACNHGVKLDLIFTLGLFLGR